MRDFQLPGRSPVMSGRAMAATSHPLATLTALDILREGGNAMDAAIAACAVQAVVEPQSTGIGGDCFCLYAPAGGNRVIAFNGSGRAPAAATTAWYRDQGMGEIPRQSAHAVTIPGAVDAWDQLARDHGRLGLGRLFEPALGYARDGYVIAPRVAFDMASQAQLLSVDPHFSKIFLKNGKPPASGSRHAQPELATTLEAIGRHGRDAFYTGAIAEETLSVLQEQGGLHQESDFREARGEYVQPIHTDYRGYRVWECPPNGQGVIALLLLNLLSRLPVDKDPNSAQRLHLEIEAAKLAYRDRNLFVADPARTEVPVDWLLSDAHAEELVAQIDLKRAATQLATPSLPPHPSTVYLSVVDEERNACSFINTLFHSHGSGITTPTTGIVLHSRGAGFVVEPGHPNTIEPGKRPLHTIIPGMVTKDDRAVMPFGVMGGEYQASGHMAFLARFIDCGLDIQEAQDATRLFPDPQTGAVGAERGFSSEVRGALEAMGHHLTSVQKPIGGSQAIWIDWEQNVLIGGSDPRKDGCALGY
ncbi:MAG: gamma-glutamyltransferase [Geminicoccaceae bacterium]